VTEDRDIERAGLVKHRIAIVYPAFDQRGNPPVADALDAGAEISSA